MAFSRYPTAPLAPLTIPMGATSTPMAFTEHFSNIGGGNRMFICVVRLASGGGPAAGARPTVILIASGGTPLEVPFNDGFASVRGPGDPTDPTDPGPVVALAKMDPTPDSMTFVQGANGVYLVEVVLLATPGTIAWEIQIRNEDAANDHDFTWVVGDTESEAQQPWIDVTASSVSVEALVTQEVTGSLTVANHGTGDLQLTGSTLPIGSEFSLPAFPLGPISPNASDNVVVTFTAPATPPAPDGITSIMASFNSADADAGATVGHNRQFTLSAMTSELEVALLLDASGSMAWQPDGDRIPPGSPPSRWDELASAANQFLDLLAAFGKGRGTFGVARFRATDPVNPSTHDIVVPGPITNSMGVAQTAISAITPSGFTHMGDGINRLLTPGANYFKTDATSENANRRCILLMSDGASNRGINPRDFIPISPPDTDTDLIDRRIKIFSAGYGVPGADDVDHELLNDMQAGSFEGGHGFRAVNVEGLSAIELANAFRDAIKSGLTLATSPSDPRGVLGDGVLEQRHQVVITSYDSRAVFILNWNTPEEGRLRFELLTPTCDLITPASVEEAGITVRSGSRYHMYIIDGTYLSGGTGGDGRYGLWTLVISRDAGGSDDVGSRGGREVYEYDVIVESRLRLTVETERSKHFTGDPINLVAHLTLDGVPIPNAKVHLDMQAPGQSVNNWLARTPISNDEFARAAEVLANDPDINPLTIKAFAIKQKGITFQRFTKATTTVPMDYIDGAYRATVTDTSVPETYEFYVTATGLTADNVLFRREKQIEVYVGVKADPDFTVFDIDYTQVILDNIRLQQANIVIRPHDRFGNVVLIDPNLNPIIQLDTNSGRFTGLLATNLDGSYSRTLHYEPDAEPVIRLDIAGDTIKRDNPVVSLTDLYYAGVVLDFQLGSEFTQGANRFRDPEAALGDVTQKRSFVALGGRGVLSLGLKSPDLLMKAQGEDDITVFVQRDADLRRYRVEALPVDNDDWLPLGESTGVTQSFGLSAAGLKRARAIRVTDLSDRIVGSDLRALSTPGVSIRGVGFKSVQSGFHWLYDVSIREVRDIRLQDIRALMEVDIDTLGELSTFKPRSGVVDLPRSRLIDVRARALLALETADKFTVVAGLEKWSLWRVSRFSVQTLMEETGATETVINRLCDHASALRLALRREFLEQVTVGEMANRRHRQFK